MVAIYMYTACKESVKISPRLVDFAIGLVNSVFLAKFTISKMICPLSSVEPLRHSARPPILKHLIKVNVTITTF